MEENRETLQLLKRHTHDGVDSPRIPYFAIENRITPLWWTIPGAQAATATNYGTIFIADLDCAVVGFQEVHEVAGSSGGSVTLQLEKLTGTTAPDSGTTLLATALSLKATANTVQTGVLVKSRQTALKKGDRLCLKDAGTLTAVSNVTVAIFIMYT